MQDEYWRDWHTALDESEKTGSIIPQLRFINKWKRINGSKKAAQRRLRLDAFGIGVGMAAILGGVVIFLYKSFRKYGGE